MTQDEKMQAGNTTQTNGNLKAVHKTVRVGNCITPIWKRQRQDGDWAYRFSIWRLMDSRPRLRSYRFRPEDVLDLPRLTQALAAALAADGCVNTELKQDLQCLDSALQWLLGESGFGDWRNVLLPRTVDEAIKGVLGYLAEEEKGHFEESPSVNHVYRHILVLENWLNHRGKGHNGSREGDHYGVCPICRQNDGHLNIGHQHWFVCHVHRLRWCDGFDRLPVRKAETREDWRKNHILIGDYDIVTPVR